MSEQPTASAEILPKKRGAVRRTITKRVRLSPHEWAQIESRLGGSDFSDSARAALIGLKPRDRALAQAEMERAAQVARFGHLINQIAKRSNEGAPRSEILVALLRLERLISGV